MDIMTHQHNITPTNTVLRVIDVKKNQIFTAMYNLRYTHRSKVNMSFGYSSVRFHSQGEVSDIRSHKRSILLQVCTYKMLSYVKHRNLQAH